MLSYFFIMTYVNPLDEQKKGWFFNGEIIYLKAVYVMISTFYIQVILPTSLVSSSFQIYCKILD